ncbi:MAG TPA: serine hydrolase domain-containing protein [Thermomicrobiales bacterium]|nr:serine hydrolase domain-containing protein [Thermomicrobiales bacterium]
MPTIQEALDTIDQWIDDGAVPGAAAAVWHRGEIIAAHTTGEATPGRHVTNDTIFALASVSKPMTAAAVMQVLDREDVDLDTPLAEILPEFESVEDPFDEDLLPQLEAQRHEVTMRQLLCHTSGLPENVGVKRIRMTALPSLGEIVDVMCNVPLQSPPGETLRYSNVGLALAARAASRLADRDFHSMLQEDILDPAGLDGIVLRPGPKLDDRVAHVDDAAGNGGKSESYNSRYWRDMGIPWGGYFGTALDVLRFATSFLPGQASPLRDDLKAQMVVDNTGGVPGGVNSAGFHWEEGAWGLGWEVKGSKRNHPTGTLTSEGTWCHWGQSGTMVWVDPARELGLSVFSNRTVMKGWPLRPPRWSTLSDAVISAVGP